MCVSICVCVVNHLLYSITHLPSVAALPLYKTHYNTLQHTATHCISLQHTATIFHALQHNDATHCSTLQHTAIHYNTLQHIVTHCNTDLPSVAALPSYSTPNPRRSIFFSKICTPSLPSTCVRKYECVSMYERVSVYE